MGCRGKNAARLARSKADQAFGEVSHIGQAATSLRNVEGGGREKGWPGKHKQAEELVWNQYYGEKKKEAREKQATQWNGGGHADNAGGASGASRSSRG